MCLNSSRVKTFAPATQKSVVISYNMDKLDEPAAGPSEASVRNCCGLYLTPTAHVLYGRSLSESAGLSRAHSVDCGGHIPTAVTVGGLTTAVHAPLRHAVCSGDDVYYTVYVHHKSRAIHVCASPKLSDSDISIHTRHPPHPRSVQAHTQRQDESDDHAVHSNMWTPSHPRGEEMGRHSGRYM